MTGLLTAWQGSNCRRARGIPVNSMERGCMWRKWVIRLIAVVLLATSSCKWKQPQTAQDELRTRLQAIKDDQTYTTSVFQKKLECSKFLGKLEGSRFGPDVKAQKNALFMNPVVFYSPKLNTCLLIERTIFGAVSHGKVYAFLEDLLTGHTVQSTNFDLTVPEDKQAFGDFEDNMLKTYGGESANSAPR